jgi:hypothetical protein
MKKIMFYAVLLVCFMTFPLGVQAYNVTINDPAGDQIGQSGFDTTKIEYNVNSDPFVVTITTNYPGAGILVGSWQTLPADLILWGAASSPPALAIPLVNHNGFTAGTVYTVGSMYTSNDMAASYGVTNPPYTWGFDQNVWLKSGTSTGITGTVLWGSPGDYLSISWATSTCANDVVGVPEPTTMLLLGFGLIGLAGIRRKFKS